ncbi:MAG: hypothetical protein EGP68_04650 [Lachnospiraceae bacterium]|nr:hypothetical protein [Lachnospiraceae bacterium]
MQQPSTEPTQGQKEQMARRFGMFLHFGINTFHNTEWSDGTLPAESYAPTAIDADGWVRTAYEAGMNYVIVITKHHDGFCMWDTHTTDYCINSSQNKTDVVAEVAKACKKYGVKLALYYSLWDRHEKCYADDEAYADYMITHLTELMDGRYGEIVELWLDGEWDKPCRSWQLDRIYNTVKTLQPKCQIGVNQTIGEFNDETGAPEERYLPVNYQENDPIRMFPSDFRLWDPNMCREDDPKIYTFNGEKYYMPFEQTICSRKDFSWFYCDIYADKPMMDKEEIIRNYKILEKTNNLMVINLPPDKGGKLVDGDVKQLLEIADALGIRRKVSAEQ